MKRYGNIFDKTTTIDNIRLAHLKRCEQGNQMTYGEWCSINSYKGWIMWCDGYNLTEKYIKPLVPYADKYYREVVKK